MEQLLFKVVMAALGGGVIAIVYFAGVWLLGFLKGGPPGTAQGHSPAPQPSSSAPPRPIIEPSSAVSSSPVDQDAIYAAIANELKTGATDAGLWTRLFAECDGDESKTKAAYIRRRALQLSVPVISPTTQVTANVVVLDKLVERPINPSNQFLTAIGAVRNYSFAQLRALIDDDDSLCTQAGDDGNTLLLVAASIGSPTCVELLLQRGSNPSHRNNMGQSALDLAQANPNVVKVALDSIKNSLSKKIIHG